MAIVDRPWIDRWSRFPKLGVVEEDGLVLAWGSSPTDTSTPWSRIVHGRSIEEVLKPQQLDDLQSSDDLKRQTDDPIQ